MSYESYNARPIAANGSLKCGMSMAGFLASVAGTITVTDADGTVLVNAAPIVTGVWTRIPIKFHSAAGGVISLGGGAAGTLFT